MTDHAKLRRLDDSEVEQLLERYIKRFPGEHKAAMSRYFEAVHQELAPLARKLEAERDRLKAENEALRKDAERWRYARTILPYEVIQDAQKDFESWNVGVSEAENKRCDEAIDAALEGATQ
ncbi:hypothetical protein [Pseudomonas aeruginosa]|uniref:hypothetical protein n=1 Tax=Pseudomonas aeruginosa TaxID=287 RepID=UPI00053F02B0|nr:hypothetical protein [Pseudomonas aeruginosa]